MTKPIRFVVLPPDGPPEDRTEVLAYDLLTTLVGYPVGVVTLTEHRAAMYLSDEGKAQGLARNERATELARPHLRPDDYIVGTALVVGLPTFGGTDTSIPDTFAREVLA
jgi:hypothetical protein